ncbi:hypothetical protein V8C44DRAFT_290138 [Trichoderma aethiopicum]
MRSHASVTVLPLLAFPLLSANTSRCLSPANRRRTRQQTAAAGIDAREPACQITAEASTALYTGVSVFAHSFIHPSNQAFRHGLERFETAGAGRQKPVEQRPRQSCSFALRLCSLCIAFGFIPYFFSFFVKFLFPLLLRSRLFAS